MLAKVVLKEGGMFIGFTVDALDYVESFKTGVLKTKYAGDITPCAMVYGDGHATKYGDGYIIYDFVVKRYGYSPIRFSPTI